MTSVSVFGLGYVGSVTAACLANMGHDVIGVDVDKAKVAAVNAGEAPIVEPGLGELMAAAVESGRLLATSDVEVAVKDTELALVCVGTPGRASGAADLGTLEQVCRDIGGVLKGRSYTVAIRSSVLPGTAQGKLLPALRTAAGNGAADVRIAMNPEFMREGTALEDFMHPPLIVAGCEDPATADQLRALYAGVHAEFVHTDLGTAEMVKFAANAFHALKVCFANEIADVCDALGADAQQVMHIFRKDRKLNVAPAYLRPGFAFGGSCLPKDLRALLHAAHRADVGLPLLDGILPSNELQVRRGVERVQAAGRRRVGVAGLAFKPDTDDLRESPMVSLVETLIGKGYDVRILDRNVQLARLTGANRRHIEETIPHLAALLCDDERELLDHAETLVVASSGAASAGLVAAAAPGCRIVDLTRGALRTDGHGGDEVLQPWQPARPGQQVAVAAR